jgi:predicted dehydrogenase
MLRRVFASFCLLLAMNSGAADLRVGIIGLDTSHVVAFTRALNDEANKDHVQGARVVAAFKSFSPDIPSSADRVEGFAEELRDKFGVKLVASVEELCAMVDVVMLENVDGRKHLELARPVIRAGKRLFIDKPLAASLADVLEIYRLADEAKVPVFTSSAYRYYDSMVELKKASVGEVRSAISYGPAHLEKTHPDFFWYGVHPAEALFAVMGTGCESVTRTSTPENDVVVGRWSGDRVGTLQGLRGKATPHKVIVFGSNSLAEQKAGSDSYAPLLRQVVTFFQTGVSPVPKEETIELFAFMAAADESKRLGGQPVRLDEVLAKARR